MEQQCESTALSASIHLCSCFFIQWTSAWFQAAMAIAGLTFIHLMIYRISQKCKIDLRVSCLSECRLPVLEVVCVLSCVPPCGCSRGCAARGGCAAPGPVGRKAESEVPDGMRRLCTLEAKAGSRHSRGCVLPTRPSPSQENADSIPCWDQVPSKWDENHPSGCYWRRAAVCDTLT